MILGLKTRFLFEYFFKSKIQKQCILFRNETVREDLATFYKRIKISLNEGEAIQNGLTTAPCFCYFRVNVNGQLR